MLYLLLGHGLQLAGVIYMCSLGGPGSQAQSGRLRALPLVLFGFVLTALLVALAVNISLGPFVLTTLTIWMAALPLAADSNMVGVNNTSGESNPD